MNHREVLFSKRSNLLEEEPYCYNLVERTTPNLFREIFPYEEIPKTPFNHRYIMMSMPDEIYITDTTFRDGQQAIVPYTVNQIENLFDMLNKLGGEKGIIRQTEFFVYSKRDQEAIYKCLEKNYKFPEITSWIRATGKDISLVKDLGIKETGILISCSDYHIYNKMGMDRKRAVNYYSKIISDIIDCGLIPRCHLEDITRADIYGFVIPLITKLKTLADEAKIKIKFRLCDTLGLGVPFSGVVLPRSVPGIISCIRHFCNLNSDEIEWHGHNDFYMGTANAVAAWLYGAAAVNCSLLGIGERTGNIPIESMVIQYASLRGTMDGMNPEIITKISDYYRDEIGYSIPPNMPFVGKDFNVTRAGIHANGMLKDEEIYNIFNTKKILNRSVGVVLNSNSGLSGIVYWYNNHYVDMPTINKYSDITIHIKKWIDKEFEKGRKTAITDLELEKIVEAFKEKKDGKI